MTMARNQQQARSIWYCFDDTSLTTFKDVEEVWAALGVVAMSGGCKDSQLYIKNVKIVH